MKRFNLAHPHRLSPQKRIHGVLSEGQVWYIAKQHNGTTYYVQTANEKSVNWTTVRAKALSFRTQAGTYHFINTHMKLRSDIYLIHAQVED